MSMSNCHALTTTGGLKNINYNDGDRLIKSVDPIIRDTTWTHITEGLYARQVGHIVTITGRKTSWVVNGQRWFTIPSSIGAPSRGFGVFVPTAIGSGERNHGYSYRCNDNDRNVYIDTEYSPDSSQLYVNMVYFTDSLPGTGNAVPMGSEGTTTGDGINGSWGQKIPVGSTYGFEDYHLATTGKGYFQDTGWIDVASGIRGRRIGKLVMITGYGPVPNVGTWFNIPDSIGSPAYGFQQYYQCYNNNNLGNNGYRFTVNNFGRVSIDQNTQVGQHFWTTFHYMVS